MDKEISSGHDETQALAVARAEEELLKKFQMMKQRSPTGMEQTCKAHPLSAPPKVTGPMFNFGSNEDSKSPRREIGNQPDLKRRSMKPTRSSGYRKTPQLLPMNWARCSSTSIERTHTYGGNPGRVPPRHPPWQQVRRTAKRRNQRSGAILIKCSEGSYADMLKLVKTEPTLQWLKDGVKGIRRRESAT